MILRRCASLSHHLGLISCTDNFCLVSSTHCPSLTISMILFVTTCLCYFYKQCKGRFAGRLLIVLLSLSNICCECEDAFGISHTQKPRLYLCCPDASNWCHCHTIAGNLTFWKSALPPVCLQPPHRMVLPIGPQLNKPNMVAVSHLLVTWSVLCSLLYYFYPTMENSQRCPIGAFFEFLWQESVQ